MTANGPPRGMYGSVAHELVEQRALTLAARLVAHAKSIDEAVTTLVVLGADDPRERDGDPEQD